MIQGRVNLPDKNVDWAVKNEGARGNEFLIKFLILHTDPSPLFWTVAPKISPRSRILWYYKALSLCYFSREHAKWASSLIAGVRRAYETRTALSPVTSAKTPRRTNKP